MTSYSLNETNELTPDDIQISLTASRLIALPIPPRSSQISSSIRIRIRVDNNTSDMIELREHFIPQLIGIHGEVLERKSSSDRQENIVFPTFTVESERPNYVDLYTRLRWQNNSLKLEIPIVSRQSYQNWIFEDLQSGHYQIRFLYRYKTELSSQQLATEYIDFWLLEPSGNNRKNLEVEGIQFETLMPETRIVVPSRETQERKNVEFGIRITNHTQSYHRFLLFFLEPIFQKKGGGMIKNHGFNTNGIKMPQQSDFCDLNPGERLTFLVSSTFYWRDNKLWFGYQDLSRRCWVFDNFLIDTYYLQFIYYNSLSTWTKHKYWMSDIVEITDVWAGEILTPVCQFRLV